MTTTLEHKDTPLFADSPIVRHVNRVMVQSQQTHLYVTSVQLHCSVLAQLSALSYFPPVLVYEIMCLLTHDPTRRQSKQWFVQEQVIVHLYYLIKQLRQCQTICTCLTTSVPAVSSMSRTMRECHCFCSASDDAAPGSEIPTSLDTLQKEMDGFKDEMDMSLFIERRTFEPTALQLQQGRIGNNPLSQLEWRRAHTWWTLLLSPMTQDNARPTWENACLHLVGKIPWAREEVLNLNAEAIQEKRKRKAMAATLTSTPSSLLSQPLKKSRALEAQQMPNLESKTSYVDSKAHVVPATTITPASVEVAALAPVDKPLLMSSPGERKLSRVKLTRTRCMEFAASLVRVGPSSIENAGNGLFAQRAFPKNTHLPIVYRGAIQLMSTVRDNPNFCSYLYAVPRTLGSLVIAPTVDPTTGKLVGTHHQFAAYINLTDQLHPANCTFTYDANCPWIISIETIVDIKAGDEFVVNYYGPDNIDARPSLGSALAPIFV